MRILIFNWKDISHPFAGGAEYVTQELAQELVKLHHRVTIFTSQPKSLSDFEKIKGVNIVRRGNSATVYFWAYRYYSKNQINFDIVIDQIHGIPFFTPLYVKQPILAYIHEIAGSIWFKEFILPIALLGIFIEKLTFIIYQRIPFLTVSYSTSEELQKNNINKKQIFVLYSTIKPRKFLKTPKSKSPMILYVGRITPMKQLDILLKSAKIIVQEISDLQIYIAGKSKTKYLNYLLKLSKLLNINKNVTFLGKINENMKFTYFRKSWLQVHLSIKEGFGLTVLEASTQATPTIAFNVPGLKHTIINNVNGCLLKSQTPEYLAKNVINLIKNKAKLKSLQKLSYDWSKNLPTFKHQAKKLSIILNNLRK